MRVIKGDEIHNLTEKFIYHIWDGQHLASDLKSVRDKKIKIHFHGNWNTDSGADFKNAIIEIDGEILRGDVEIHQKSYDWQVHNHHQDPNFNSVILHVVYQHKMQLPVTINESGKAIEVLELEHFLDDDILKLLSQYSTKKYQPRDQYCKAFSCISNDFLPYYLMKHGQKRFINKIRRFDAEMLFSNFDQILYQGIMEALGYSKNKFQMILLANSLSYSKFLELKNKYFTLEDFIAVFMGYSGLLDKMPTMFSSKNIEYWKYLYERINIINMDDKISWNLFRLRPINHPVIRILQILPFFVSSSEAGLLNTILQIFSFPKNTFSITKFKQRYYKLFDYDISYLPDNYKLGKTRLDIIMVNIILPIMKLYSQKMNYISLSKIVDEIYLNYGALSTNNIIQKMGLLMQSSQKKIVGKKSISQQGLLKIYYNFCQYRLCDQCYNDLVKILHDFKKDTIN